jgi:hypothetical protein
MLPERTTTTGDSLPVATINPFHMINAEVTIIPATRNILNFHTEATVATSNQHSYEQKKPQHN